MSISSEQLKHLTSLAYLQIEPETEMQLKNDINAIIDFVAQLQSVDTTHVEALRHPMDVKQRLRKDEPCLDIMTETLAKIAPQFKDGLYLVPKVITTER